MDLKEDDRFQRLLQLTGNRPDVPDDIYERVKSNVHSRWKKTVRLRTWNRRLIVAFTALAFACSLYVCTLHYFNREYPVPVGLVENISGDVFVTPQTSSPHLLSKGEVLAAGTRLESGESGRLLVRLVNGASIRMDLKTLLHFNSENSFLIEKGGVYVDTHRKKVKMALSTPLGTVKNQGTQFEVRVEQQLVRIRVREGSILLERKGPPKTALAGTELAIDKRGKTSMIYVPGYGPHWSWISSISPGFRLEGHTLQEFLHWVSRENGWTISYAENEVKQNSSKIVLHGSIANVSPDEMLSAVLATCSLKYSIDEGVLRVQREDSK